MKEEQDLGSICVSFGDGEDVEITMSDVKVIDSFMGETWRYGGAFFFGFAEENGELLDGRHGDVAPIVSRKKGLTVP